MSVTLPRFTIERLRTLVLIGGVLLVAAIVIFLAAGQWTRRFLSKDLPNHLGINIEQQANGIIYTQTHKGKTIFKLHAARADTMKTDGKTVLHDVKIDLYGDDGQRADTIAGSEFEYDAKAGIATAAGAVEIVMMRPGVKPAITQLKPGNSKPHIPPSISQGSGKADGLDSGPNRGVANGVAGQIADDQIHVKTSGLIFNQKSGVATTDQRVDFALRQGNGNSVGATYDSQKGQLILDRAVELHVERADGPVTIHAGHAEFEHGEILCKLSTAKAEFSGSTAQTGDALIHFREDGSVARLDGSGGVDLETKSGGHVTAPTGSLEFDENNHPQHGLLEGGTRLEMNEPNRQIDASSPMARLTFDHLGELSQAHMEQGVLFNSRQQATTAKGVAAQIHRSWQSQSADVGFAPVVEGSKAGEAKGHVPREGQTRSQAHNQTGGQAQGRVEPRTIHGYGGVVITSETSSGGVATPSRLSADTVVAELAPGGTLSSLLGTGHASFDERTAAGVHQASAADQLDVHFVPGSGLGSGLGTGLNSAAGSNSAAPLSVAKSKESGGASEIASVVEVGHVVLTQDAPPAHASQTSQKGGLPEGQSALRATAGRADYDGKSQVLHLTVSPRVLDGGLDMSAERIDFARATGDAFAHGDVRASWIGANEQKNSPPATASVTPPGSSLLNSGGNGPVHAIAAEAELHQASQEAVFRGASNSSGYGQPGIEPRLWQSVNSVSAPVIVLNRQKMTLTAEGNGAANPVRTVLVGNAPVSSSAKAGGKNGQSGGESVSKQTDSKSGNATSSNGSSKTKADGPSVIRVRSGDLRYSEAERRAIFHSGSAGEVTAETTNASGTATIVSQEAEVKLLPAGTHPAGIAVSPGNVSSTANSQSPANSSIDRLTAQGHVTADWPARKGTGEKLVYLNEDGSFTLTGTSAIPPRITDQARGTITGSAVIYHSREDSVTVEGDGGKTETETRSKK